jgi:acyl carrier protein
MSRQEIEKLLVEVLSVVLAHPVNASVTRAEDKAWDSLKHIEIVFAVEDRFKVRFTEDEIAESESLVHFAGILQERLAA